jgi:hypothetical protein
VIKGELEAMVAGTAYGHIALVVDDLDATLAALAEQGIEPERPPYAVREGGSLLTFVRDPVNGYRIELHAPDQAGRSTARPRIGAEGARAVGHLEGALAPGLLRRSRSGQSRMERLWSPAVAIGGSR